MGDRARTTPDQPAAPTLPSDRAFVVQFVAETRDEGGVRGRVEHVTSGEAMRFDSWARLRRFVEGRLRDTGRPQEADNRRLTSRRDRA